MKTRTHIAAPSAALVAFVTFLGQPPAMAENFVDLPFDAERWDPKPVAVATSGGKALEFLKPPPAGVSHLVKGVTARDLIIEADFEIIDGQANYPGFIFRDEGPEGGREHVYVRPQASGKPEAVQYAPNFLKNTEWRLFAGRGYTAAAEFPRSGWFHLKVLVKGSHAAVFVGGSETPALSVDNLVRTPTTGRFGVGLTGPARVRNFRYAILDGDVAPAGTANARPASKRKWELAVAPFGVEQHPAALTWKAGFEEPNHAIPFGKYLDNRGKIGWARTTIEAKKAERRRLRIGGCDKFAVFLNGTVVSTGAGKGPLDTLVPVELDLKRGKNELVLSAAQGFGGWGVIVLDD